MFSHLIGHLALVAGPLLEIVIPSPFSVGLRLPWGEAFKGEVREFHLTLTWEEHAPDGFSRNMILTNGEVPRPLLEANQGDEVWVTVRNELPFNTTMHFHGTISRSPDFRLRESETFLRNEAR